MCLGYFKVLNTSTFNWWFSYKINVFNMLCTDLVNDSVRLLFHVTKAIHCTISL